MIFGSTNLTLFFTYRVRKRSQWLLSGPGKGDPHGPYMGVMFLLPEKKAGESAPKSPKPFVPLYSSLPEWYNMHGENHAHLGS